MNFDIGTLYPKQIEFCKATNKYICYGGARGGGKSHISRIKMCLLALNYPGIQILLLRRTLKELRENHINELYKMLKCSSNNRIATYRDSTKEFLFGNGSRIVLGYCDSEKDVLQYQGQAYEVITLEEATHFTEFQFQTLTESNRMSGNLKVDFNPRMYFTCNPGGVGHQWVKRLFIDRKYTSSENPDDYYFIPSNVYENKYLMEHDAGYVKTLENLPEDRKKAMLYGDWDVFEGQYFTEFDRNIHTIEPIVIPEHWNRYIAFDYGLDKFAVLFVAIDFKGKAYVYNEIHKEGLIVSDAAQMLKSYMRKDIYKAVYAPPDLWAIDRHTGKSTAEVFRDNGVILTQASNKRIPGWLDVKEWIKVRKVKNEQTGELEETSNLVIFNTCKNLIEYLPMIQHDEKDVNDVATEPHELTHICDALRYFCVSRTSPGKEPEIVNDVFNFKEEEPTSLDYGEDIIVV